MALYPYGYYGGHSWLNRLDLSNNQAPWRACHVGVFLPGFYQLGHLDLSGNLLTSLDEEFFRNHGTLPTTLPLVDSLDLSDNSLTSLPPPSLNFGSKLATW